MTLIAPTADLSQPDLFLLPAAAGAIFACPLLFAPATLPSSSLLLTSCLRRPFDSSSPSSLASLRDRLPAKSTYPLQPAETPPPPPGLLACHNTSLFPGSLSLSQSPVLCRRTSARQQGTHAPPAAPRPPPIHALSTTTAHTPSRRGHSSVPAHRDIDIHIHITALPCIESDACLPLLHPSTSSPPSNIQTLSFLFLSSHPFPFRLTVPASQTTSKQTRLVTHGSRPTCVHDAHHGFLRVTPPLGPRATSIQLPSCLSSTRAGRNGFAILSSTAVSPVNRCYGRLQD